MFKILVQSLTALGMWLSANKEPYPLTGCIFLGFILFVYYWLVDLTSAKNLKHLRGVQDSTAIPEDQLPPAKEPPPIPRPWLEVEQLPASVIQDAMRAANSRVLTPEQKAYIQGRNNAISEVRAKSEGSVVIAANAQGAVLDVFVQQPQESDHDMY